MTAPTKDALSTPGYESESGMRGWRGVGRRAVALLAENPWGGSCQFSRAVVAYR
jgi:hypothetical protein